MLMPNNSEETLPYGAHFSSVSWGLFNSLHILQCRNISIKTEDTFTANQLLKKPARS